MVSGQSAKMKVSPTTTSAVRKYLMRFTSLIVLSSGLFADRTHQGSRSARHDTGRDQPTLKPLPSGQPAFLGASLLDATHSSKSFPGRGEGRPAASRSLGSPAG